MTKMMLARRLTICALVISGSVITTGALSAHQEKRTDKAAASLTGTWTMTANAHDGQMTGGLVLKQEGRKVTGTFSSPHGDLPFEGEFVDGTLTFTVNIEDADHKGLLTFKATLKPDGTLAGTVTTPMGDMTWTATRAR